VSDKSAIEWTDASWNPVTGCTEVSAGCDHCYARTFAERWRGIPGHPYEQGFDLKLWPERLDVPLRWRRPRRVFVNSMSDLFHDDVDDEFIGQVFAVMSLARQHQFQVLTKRPGRMASLVGRESFRELVDTMAVIMDGGYDDEGNLPGALEAWPLPNVWLGTSVEDQRWADIRIPKLLETPAAVRFLSCEPLLGPIDLRTKARNGALIDSLRGDVSDPRDGVVYAAAPGSIDWIIVGGESGHGARPMDSAWVRSLRDQCTDAGVAFFFKQWGGRTPKAGGRELDGRTWDEMPAELQPIAV